MDAHALLSAQGWRGTGHSLHKTDDSIGLAKPLLLNRKTNTKGLGNTKHFTSDLWWMDAFDEQLKGLDTSKEGKVEQTVTTGKLNALDPGRVSKYSIYASFVRGGFLQGTITPDLTDGSTSTESETSDNTKTVSSKETKSTKPKKESKEEKRARKEEKRARKEEKRKRKEARALRRAAKAERRLRRAEAKKDTSDSNSSTAEEKRLRRARKEEKRRRKELEKKKATGG
ncbi:hypothetical protein BBK36DRAFT_1139775 [Trichoderma citrinoviride]|uniref:G-patch domain-containing protein n=1 Tax=Trichoderma citrinoviride TaxID=58853 RepID=A0A2T4BG78_9HYPO|nr:hypothetical protein BBK36DRAFT_1139775 [Trichoderma citrinoviride]PTB68278.1 hypothetical protein BBK36DRAFT_1139775 [Trichoderma citrinoviride]